jgi:hypothetical protein
MGAAKTKADKMAIDDNVDDIGETVLTWLSWSFFAWYFSKPSFHQEN